MAQCEPRLWQTDTESQTLLAYILGYNHLPSSTSDHVRSRVCCALVFRYGSAITNPCTARQRTYFDLHSFYFSAPPAACAIPASPADTEGPSSHRPASLPRRCTSAGREKQRNTGLRITSFKTTSSTSQQERDKDNCTVQQFIVSHGHSSVPNDCRSLVSSIQMQSLFSSLFQLGLTVAVIYCYWTSSRALACASAQDGLISFSSIITVLQPGGHCAPLSLSNHCPF